MLWRGRWSQAHFLDALGGNPQTFARIIVFSEYLGMTKSEWPTLHVGLSVFVGALKTGLFPCGEPNGSQYETPILNSQSGVVSRSPAKKTHVFTQTDFRRRRCNSAPAFVEEAIAKPRAVLPHPGSLESIN